MKLERIKYVADALELFVEEIKASEVTGVQLTYIGKLDEKFADNLKYLTELIIVPETTVDEPAIEEPVEIEQVETTNKNEEAKDHTSYNYNDRAQANHRIQVDPVEAEYRNVPTLSSVRLSKNADCQILINGVWVPISPTVEKVNKSRNNERMVVQVQKSRHLLSRLMLETFVGLPCPKEYYTKSSDYFTPYFKDGNRRNCAIDNLLWGIIRSHGVVPLVSHNSDTGFVVHPRYPEIRVNENGEIQRLICGVWTEAVMYNSNGKYMVNVTTNGPLTLITAGKLILETFKGFPNSKLDTARFCVRHKDGDWTNLHLNNLEWCNTRGIPYETESKISKADRANTLKMEGDILNGCKNVIDIFAQTKDITLAETLLKKKAENHVPFTQDDRFVAVLTCTSGTSNGNRIMQKINKKYGKQYITKLLLNQVQNKTYRKELCDLVF